MFSCLCFALVIIALSIKLIFRVIALLGPELQGFTYVTYVKDYRPKDPEDTDFFIFSFGFSNVVPALIQETALFVKAMRWLFLVHIHKAKDGVITRTYKAIYYSWFFAALMFMVFVMIRDTLVLTHDEEIIVMMPTIIQLCAFKLIDLFTLSVFAYSWYFFKNYHSALLLESKKSFYSKRV